MMSRLCGAMNLGKEPDLDSFLGLALEQPVESPLLIFDRWSAEVLGHRCIKISDRICLRTV